MYTTKLARACPKCDLVRDTVCQGGEAWLAAGRDQTVMVPFPLPARPQGARRKLDVVSKGVVWIVVDGFDEYLLSAGAPCYDDIQVGNIFAFAVCLSRTLGYPPGQLMPALQDGGYNAR